MAHFECRKHQHGGDFFGQSQRTKKIKNQSELNANSFSPLQARENAWKQNGVVLDFLLLGQENDVQLFTSLNTKRRQEPITRHSAPRRFPSSSQGLFLSVFIGRSILRYILEHLCPRKWKLRSVYERIWSSGFEKWQLNVIGRSKIPVSGL